jgi:hypothetical protein
MTADEIRRRLAAPFPADALGWKPATVSNGKALAICFVDARAVMSRLDEVLGVDGWRDEFTPLPEGSMLCRLSCRIGDQWITKCDVGGESDQKDTGDRAKSAVSDALKRAAVKFGVARYLYDLPSQWVPYDEKRRTFTQKPTLPAWALPQASEPIASRKKFPEANAKPAIAATAPARAADDPDDIKLVDGPPTRITDDEEAELAALIRKSGADPARFLAHFKVRSVGQLSRGQLPTARQMLLAKLAKPSTNGHDKH